MKPNQEPEARNQTETCMDCDGKGHFVSAADFIAHDCPTCKGEGQVPV